MNFLDMLKWGQGTEAGNSAIPALLRQDSINDTSRLGALGQFGNQNEQFALTAPTAIEKPEIGGLFNSLAGYGDLFQGAASLFGAYNGLQQGKLAKKQFNFTKDATNRNLANQATVTNEALRARQGGRNSFSGTNRKAPQVSGAPI